MKAIIKKKKWTDRLMNSIASALLNQMKEKNMGINITVRPQDLEGEQNEISESR